ncbi:phosphotransferase enzyme family protein [Xylariaceae sp. FL0662B]|nr:phosphotransferase enzyme family protein [Xylariaceae sp. FL0662B]
MDREITQEDFSQATGFGRFCCVYLLADKKTIVKSGSTTRMTEAETMKFVRKHTKVPVPEVYNAYNDKKSGRVRIVMEYVEGERLDHVWDKFTADEKKSVTSQLRDYFDELRQISGSVIGSVDGSECRDVYFPEFEVYQGPYGPYENEAGFNQALVKAWSTGRDDPFTLMLCDVLCETMKDHGTVMTHNDLYPRNILVRGSEVVAILDWESAGFYPEYWEYCRALWRPDWESNWMKDRAVDKILKPYYKEVAVIWNTSYTFW